MNIRLTQEKREQDILSPYASLSSKSLGRNRYEKKCDIRTDFQRDKDRILHCKSFRRLKHKTQVFISPEGDHYRTRLTHTLEVSQIARTIARALSLNEDLTEAIALGHDLGHTPFGHTGENILNSICKFGFKHNEQSVRVVEVLENDLKGLNLVYEVRDGILNHKTSTMPNTLEGKIVRISDKIAYINHDIDDAIRGKIICESDLPKEYIEIVGETFSHRINNIINDIIINSIDKNDIICSDDVNYAINGIRQYMFKNVYIGSSAKHEEKKVEYMIEKVFEYYCNNKDKLFGEYKEMLENGEDIERVVCDYIAGMTDRYIINLFLDNFIPKSWGII